MPTVDPDPAGIGTYLVSAVLLALGIAIFLYILISEARAHRGQEQDGREDAAETGAAPGLSSAAGAVAVPVALRQSTRNPVLPCDAYCVCTLSARYRSLVQNLRWAGTDHPAAPVQEQPCLLRPLLLWRSVDAMSLCLNHGEVSLHLVQSGKTHKSRAMNALPSRASVAASRSFGSVARTRTMAASSLIFRCYCAPLCDTVTHEQGIDPAHSRPAAHGPALP